MRAFFARLFHFESELTVRLAGWAQLRVNPNLVWAAVVVAILAAVLFAGMVLGRVSANGPTDFDPDGPYSGPPARPGVRAPRKGAAPLSGPSEHPRGGVSRMV